MKLFKNAGTIASGSEMLRPPQNGLMIGGTQKVTTYSQTSGSTKPSSGAKCCVSHGGGGEGMLGRWVPLAGGILVLRRRRRRPRSARIPNFEQGIPQVE
jgi:hypothetical protein